MSVKWSGLSPELLLSVDRASSLPLRSQLEEQLRDAIRSGRLRATERLPSSRVLAQELRLSRGLVQDAYAQLQAEGYLTSRVGSATQVASTAARPPSPGPTAIAAPPPLSVDFASGVPDLSLAPRADWAWAVREVCRTAPNTAFDYGDPAGSPHLRDVLAAYLRRVRAVDARAAQVLVCSGMAQALNLVFSVVRRRGSALVGYEDPGPLDTVAAAARASWLPTVPIPVDQHGIDVAALEASRATGVVVTPAHQWPTGVVLSAQRRLDLVRWARRRAGLIIEDDYDAEFRYDREPVGAVQGLAPDCVVSLGTVSKSLSPALRLGWAVLPPSLVAAVTEAKLVADRGTSGLDQLALAALIESGRYDRHLRRMRLEYSGRRDTLVQALDRYAPQVLSLIHI